MKHLIIAAAAAAFLTAISGARAQNAGFELGTLECNVAGGGSFIIGSTKDVVCKYTPADKALSPETYRGKINKIGIDVGLTEKTRIAWVVFGPSKNVYAPAALAGNYVGATAGASAGIGAGANLLVGGSKNMFTLQPLSVQAQTGLNLAVGVADLSLRSTAG